MKTRTVYQLKISLRDIKPAIWRRIQVWEDTKLPQLHRILQLLFSWEDCHLHDFVVGRRRYSVPSPDDKEFLRKVVDEEPVRVSTVLDHVGATIDYHYDFGDNWHHTILLEGIMLPETNVYYPHCIAGARNAPPEDSGGASGYPNYLEALADPAHEEHQSMLDWRGPFDPEAFSLEEVNAEFKKAFSRGRTKNFVPPKIRENSTGSYALELTDRERELILNDSFAPEEVMRKLRTTPKAAEPAIASYTLKELEALSCIAASEYKRTRGTKRGNAWKALGAKIWTILEAHVEKE